METRLKILNYASEQGWLWLVKWSMSKKLAQRDLAYAMYLAAFYGNLRVLKYFFEKKRVSPLARWTSSGEFKLLQASVDHLGVLKYLVRNGLNVNAFNQMDDMRDEGGLTPLMCAAKFGLLETVKFLVANGANVNAADDKGLTPLMYAAKKGYFEIVKFLVANGANVNAVDINGNTAFIYAAKNVVTMDDLKICSFFRDNGGDVNYQNNEGKSAGTYLLTCPLLNIRTT